MKLCETCKKRKTCVRLCEEAEKYVSQDHVPMYEFIHSGDNETEEVYHDNLFNSGFDTFFTSEYDRMKYLVVMLYRDNVPIDLINYHISLSEEEIKKIIKKYRRNYKRCKGLYTDEAIINM